VVTRFTALTDVAGRVALDTQGNKWVTAAAVVLASNQLDLVRSLLPATVPKWRNCHQEHAELVTDLLGSHSFAVCAIHINKDTEHWRRFWKDEEPLQAAIVAESRASAGFVKPANILKFFLFGQVVAIATAHAMKVAPTGTIVDGKGLTLVESNVICDSDINGDENVEFFKFLFERENHRPSRLRQLGIRLVNGSVEVATEEEEPLLLLADYAAGLAHAVWLEHPGRGRFPLAKEEALRLLKAIEAKDKFIRMPMDFEISYDEIFGALMERSRALKRQ
jgi:hypothetical protein